MNSNRLLLLTFTVFVVYVNSTCLSCLLAKQPVLSAPLCGAPVPPALAAGYGVPLPPDYYSPALPPALAAGLGLPCGLPVAPPPPAIGCGVCGPKPLSVSISPCLGLITKLKGKLCAKLCGGALNPLGLKLGGGCALPPPVLL